MFNFYSPKISFLFLQFKSLPFVTDWRRRNIRSSISTHGKSRAKHLRHNGGTASGNPVGLSFASRKLSREFISSSEHLIARKCCLLYEFVFCFRLSGSCIHNLCDFGVNLIFIVAMVNRRTSTLSKHGAGNRSQSFMRRMRVWCVCKNCSRLTDHPNFQ